MSNGMSRHTIRVWLSGESEPVEVETANPDLILWDTTSAKNKWPSMKDAPALWCTFLAWRAMRRLGLTEATWEVFSSDLCVDVEMVGEADVDPTQQAADEG